MDNKNLVFKKRLRDLLAEWAETGKPTRTGFQTEAEKLIQWRNKDAIPGLWEVPPLLVTATIDDGWGHGLQLIHLWAEAIGLKVQPLGLLVKAEQIIRECNRLAPDFLGITVLQFDSEDDLRLITRNLPSKTRVIAGGPVFSPDPELAQRAGIHFVAGNAAEFVDFMLKFNPTEKE